MSIASGELTGLAAQAEALATGTAGSAEIVAACLDSIEASQPTLNAFRCVRAEAAMEEARECDRRIAAGERAPLLGVPVAIKDDTDLAGETTAFRLRRGVRADYEGQRGREAPPLGGRGDRR